MPIMLDLFLTFAKIGLFTFGGGLAMISLIENTCVQRKKWITHEDMMNLTVIAESTPGPIAINCATFVGYKQKGYPGAFLATLGMIMPSFLIILLISSYLDRFLEIAWVASAFKGIRVAVGLLILDAAVKMIRKMPKKRVPLAMMIGASVLMLLVNFFSWHLSSVVILLAAGVVSLSLFIMEKASGKGGA